MLLKIRIKVEINCFMSKLHFSQNSLILKFEARKRSHLTSKKSQTAPCHTDGETQHEDA